MPRYQPVSFRQQRLRLFRMAGVQLNLDQHLSRLDIEGIGLECAAKRNLCLLQAPLLVEHRGLAEQVVGHLPGAVGLGTAGPGGRRDGPGGRRCIDHARGRQRTCRARLKRRCQRHRFGSRLRTSGNPRAPGSSRHRARGCDGHPARRCGSRLIRGCGPLARGCGSHRVRACRSHRAAWRGSCRTGGCDRQRTRGCRSHRAGRCGRQGKRGDRCGRWSGRGREGRRCRRGERVVQRLVAKLHPSTERQHRDPEAHHQADLDARSAPRRTRLDRADHAAFSRSVSGQLLALVQVLQHLIDDAHTILANPMTTRPSPQSSRPP